MVDFQSRDTRRAPSDDGTDPEADATGNDETADHSDTEPNEGEETFSYAVVRVTGEGSVKDDDVGDAVVAGLERGDGIVTTRDLVQPEYDGLQNVAVALTDREDVDAVVFVGGTGVEPSDRTVDALDPLFDKHLPGFGELFRRYATDAVGSATIRTRATAGIIDGVPVFVLPGNADAARMSIDRLVIPEAPALAEDASSQ
ncbi:MAG: molybdopterin-binding protein [Halovenus sp.]